MAGNAKRIIPSVRDKLGALEYGVIFQNIRAWTNKTQEIDTATIKRAYRSPVVSCVGGIRRLPLNAKMNSHMMPRIKMPMKNAWGIIASPGMILPLCFFGYMERTVSCAIFWHIFSHSQVATDTGRIKIARQAKFFPLARLSALSGTRL